MSKLTGRSKTKSKASKPAKIRKATELLNTVIKPRKKRRKPKTYVA